MKKFIALSFLFFSITNFAQEKEQVLKVTYGIQTKIDPSKLSIKVEGMSISQKEMENAIKKAMEEVRYFDLTISGNETNYIQQEKINNDALSGESFQISFSGGKGHILYTNIEKGTFEQEMSSWNKDFIIKDSLQIMDWNISRDKKQILGYQVRKATAEKDSTLYTAWFAPKLAFKTGPEKFGGLPGLILELTKKKLNGSESETTYTANQIELISDENPIKRPKKGKEVSQSEFDKINDEMAEKFKEMYNGGVDTSD